jgi:hypothetical protein
VTIPHRKHNLSENPRAAIWLFNRVNSSFVLLNVCLSQTFDLSKLSSEIDFDASTMTNKSMLLVLQGRPWKVILFNILGIGGGVGGGDIVGALVGRPVGSGVGGTHRMSGQVIPATSTKYCSFNVPNFPVTPSLDAIQVKQVPRYKLRPNTFGRGGLYLNGDTHSSPLGLT